MRPAWQSLPGERLSPVGSELLVGAKECIDKIKNLNSERGCANAFSIYCRMPNVSENDVYIFQNANSFLLQFFMGPADFSNPTFDSMGYKHPKRPLLAQFLWPEFRVYNLSTITVLDEFYSYVASLLGPPRATIDATPRYVHGTFAELLKTFNDINLPQHAAPKAVSTPHQRAKKRKAEEGISGQPPTPRQGAAKQERKGASSLKTVATPPPSADSRNQTDAVLSAFWAGAGYEIKSASLGDNNWYTYSFKEPPPHLGKRVHFKMTSTGYIRFKFYEGKILYFGSAEDCVHCLRQYCAGAIRF